MKPRDPLILRLIATADAYKSATGTREDKTVSSRVFNDSKKLSAIRDDNKDITVTRFNAAMAWFRDNWPEGKPLPDWMAERSESAA